MGVYLGKIPVGIILKSYEGDFIPCDVEQIITCHYCKIHITEGSDNSKYGLGWFIDGDYQKLYIIER